MIERKIHRLLAGKVTTWWRIAAEIVLREACEIAHARNDRELWVLIDRAYAKGDPWPWPED